MFFALFNLILDVYQFIFGIGGEYDGDRKIEDLKLLYRAYVSDALSGGRLEDSKVNDHDNWILSVNLLACLLSIH